MCPSNKRTCTPFSQESGEKRNWAKFFLPDDKTCKTRYVAESSSDFQFLVYCWNSNGKSQPEISLGRLSTSRERKLSLALKQKISERTSTLLFPGIDFHVFFLHMCVLRSNIIWTYPLIFFCWNSHWRKKMKQINGIKWHGGGQYVASNFFSPWKNPKTHCSLNHTLLSRSTQTTRWEERLPSSALLSLTKVVSIDNPIMSSLSVE